MRAENRWQAFGIHLGISFLIFLFLLGVIVFLWFPGVFIHFGGYQGIKIVAGVDLILGPFLTLIIFNRKKNLLKLDLAIIASIQFLALAAGIWVIYNERPMVQILSDDAVYIHSLSEFKATKSSIKDLPKFRSAYPKVIYLDLPEDEKTINQIKSMNTLFDDRPITMREELYVDLHKVEPTKLSVRLKIASYDIEENCFWLKVDSYHKTGKGCFNISNGLVKLK